VKLWESDFMLPFEVSELSAHFRQIVGWNETVKRFIQQQQQQQPRASSGDGGGLNFGEFSIHQHSEFTPRPDELGQSHAEKEERRKDRMHRRMNKQMTQKKAGGAGSGRRRGAGGTPERRSREGEGEAERERSSTTEEGETEEDEAGRDDGPNRNCLLMDEGGDIEAEQEEEEVESIANDLEVWYARVRCVRCVRSLMGGAVQEVPADEADAEGARDPVPQSVHLGVVG
jgi:hypothetical protein